ncbi:hypothetical protein [Porphyrobacter sp. YT40]|uniref:hypothetical protein n=1 Tax=Porphyrobacter sp. YT40 TaxID=2547601 RepID=UPI00114165BC|nr:hypothetical protein [Porphyrobacter sp. YT40]QDH33463.1 hypothetical protein E2E27_03380 [Porphyrobacter sp. YT40]
MKFAPLAAFGLALAAVTAPLAVTAQETPAPAPAFSIDTPVEVLVADARAKAVLDKYLPGIDQHPAYDQFRALSLRTLAPFSQGMITEEMLAKIEADLTAIK